MNCGIKRQTVGNFINKRLNLIRNSSVPLLFFSAARSWSLFHEIHHTRDLIEVHFTKERRPSLAYQHYPWPESATVLIITVYSWNILRPLHEEEFRNNRCPDDCSSLLLKFIHMKIREFLAMKTGV